MDYQQSITKFLSRKENLEVALEIDDYIGEIKENLRLKFWNTVISKVEKLLEGQEWGQEWEVGPRQVRGLEGRNDEGSNAGIEIRQAFPPGEVEIVVNAEQQWSSKNELVYGLWVRPWDKRQKPPYSNSNVYLELRECFEDTAFKTAGNQQGAPVECHTGHYFGSKKMLLDLASEQSELYDFADELVAFLEEHRSTIKEKNEKLVDSQPQL